MHITVDDLVAILRDNDLRITQPRIAVCTVIAERHDEHLTAASIFEAVQASSDSDVDIATVYRTLDVLEESGAITHGHIGHGPTVYHLAEEADHQHLVCSRCGTTVAIPTERMTQMLSGITADTGFVPNAQHFALSGLCSQCAQVQETR